MEVICLESEALKELIKELARNVKVEQKMDQPKWISPARAMELLNIKKTTLQTLRTSSLIIFTKPTPKIILYEYNSIIKYLDDSVKKAF
jgi:hypothetical protein